MQRGRASELSRQLTEKWLQTSRSPPQLRNMLLSCTKLFESGVDVVSDCLELLLCWQHGMQPASQPHRPQGLARRSWWRTRVEEHSVKAASVQKMKSRQSPDDIVDGGMAHGVLGTGRADKFAQKDADMHALDKSDEVGLTVYHKMVKRVAKLATALALFLEPVGCEPQKPISRGAEGLGLATNPVACVRVVRRSVALPALSHGSTRWAMWWAWLGRLVPSCHAWDCVLSRCRGVKGDPALFVGCSRCGADQPSLPHVVWCSSVREVRLRRNKGPQLGSLSSALLVVWFSRFCYLC